MNLEKIVCNCMNITNGDIKKAVEDGADTLEKVQEMTEAGTVCGVCCDDIQNLIDYFTSEQSQ